VKTLKEQITITRYVSDVDPALVSESPIIAETIEWADANPVVWKIVRGTRSAPFGKNASTYLGSGRGDSPSSAIYRAGHLRAESLRKDFWGWRARFALEHYGDKGFRGGFFQQFDGQYNRGCCDLDYTPDTLDEVIAQFVEWCGPLFETREVRIDGKSVRVFRRSA
jgi:hypothetical protein